MDSLVTEVDRGSGDRTPDSRGYLGVPASGRSTEGQGRERGLGASLEEGG